MWELGKKGWMEGRMDGRKGGWKERWMEERVGGRKGGWKEGWMEGRVDGRKGGWKEEWMEERWMKECVEGCNGERTSKRMNGNLFFDIKTKN